MGRNMGKKEIESMAPKTAGFTVMEFIVVLVIAGILGVTAYVKWPGKSINIHAQTDLVIQDIRYAQSLAMARATTGQRCRITFGTSSYTITDNVGTAVKSVPLDSGLTFAGIGFTGGVLAFDGLGRPYSGTTLMTGNLSLSLTGGGLTKTMTVVKNTGAVQ